MAAMLEEVATSNIVERDDFKEVVLQWEEAEQRSGDSGSGGDSGSADKAEDPMRQRLVMGKSEELPEVVDEGSGEMTEGEEAAMNLVLGNTPTSPSPEEASTSANGGDTSLEDVVAKAIEEVSDIFLAEGALSSECIAESSSSEAIAVAIAPRSPHSPKSKSPETYHAISPKHTSGSPPAFSPAGGEAYEAREIEKAIVSSSPRSSPHNSPKDKGPKDAEVARPPALTEEAPWNPF